MTLPGGKGGREKPNPNPKTRSLEICKGEPWDKVWEPNLNNPEGVGSLEKSLLFIHSCNYVQCTCVAGERWL